MTWSYEDPTGKMNDWEIDQWSSHRLILEPLLDNITMRTIVEMGVGRFSTPNLVKRCYNMISLENEVEWAETMARELDEYYNLWIDYQDTKDLSDRIEKYLHLAVDLLFVDHSGGPDRRQAVLKGMDCKIPYIVMHDFTEDDEAAISPHVQPTYQLFSTAGKHFNPTAFYSNNRFALEMMNRIHQ